jgi:hypothetical protein
LSKFLKYPFIFLGKKKEKKNYKDLSVSQHLSKFAKIPKPEFYFIFKKKKKKQRGILGILI